MAWSIDLLSNTIKISKKMAQKIYEATMENGYNDTFDGVESVRNDDGFLDFNPDHMEHMDYLWKEEVQKAFCALKVNGEVHFADNEGDSKGKMWGYRFKNGTFTKLVGKVVMESVDDE